MYITNLQSIASLLEKEVSKKDKNLTNPLKVIYSTHEYAWVESSINGNLTIKIFGWTKDFPAVDDLVIIDITTGETFLSTDSLTFQKNQKKGPAGRTGYPNRPPLKVVKLDDFNPKENLT